MFPAFANQESSRGGNEVLGRKDGDQVLSRDVIT